MIIRNRNVYIIGTTDQLLLPLKKLNKNDTNYSKQEKNNDDDNNHNILDIMTFLHVYFKNELLTLSKDIITCYFQKDMDVCL